jgi:hypothetical protein
MRYYKRFMKGFGSICRLLTQLLRNDVFVCNEEDTKTFINLKRIMTYPPILALPNPNKLFMVEPDASRASMRVMLMQEGHPITYISKSLEHKQHSISTNEREMMPIILVVTKWKYYL